MPQAHGILIAMGGLPGVGKSTIANRFARMCGALHLRIDTIEQSLSRAGIDPETMGPAGYAVAYAVAEDHLRLGHTVVADCVNPLGITREAWRTAALRTGAHLIEVEVCCSDAVEHRRRVESRTADIEGHILPAWSDVLSHRYETWCGDHMVIDTARLGIDACTEMLGRPWHAAMSARGSNGFQV